MKIEVNRNHKIHANETDLGKVYQRIGADHKLKYSIKLKENARKKGIILTGFIKGEKLNQIFSHAKLFVLPSYHEGLPISLLEAMSYNLDILASNISANLEVNLHHNNYFKVGDIQSLRRNIERKLSENNKVNYLPFIEEKYSWDTIADEFSDLLKNN